MIEQRIDVNDHPAVLDLITEFIKSEVIPLEEANAQILDDPRRVYGPEGGYSPEVVDLKRRVRTAASRAGLYQLFVPTDLGGGGGGPLLSYKAWEHLYHLCGPGRELPYDTLSHWTSGPSKVLRGLRPELKDTVLPQLVSGEISMCFALSEPDAGSDLYSMTTNAQRDGDGWVINGRKMWISNSPYANYACIFAVTDPAMLKTKKGGVSAFLVPTTTPGYRVEEVIKLYGALGGNESILSFTDMRVPGHAIFGEENQAFKVALEGVSLGRMYNAGRCVGLARWALEQATEWSKNRKQFGEPIANFQAIQFHLAECAIKIYASKMMSLDCAQRLESGQKAIKEMSIVKAYTTEMCFDVYDRAMQVFGGRGLTNEFRLYDGWQQARTVRIADGSGEIMRRTLANRLLKGDLDF